MSVRGPALRNTDLRSRHAYMRLAVAHATIPPRRTAPTRPGRHRPAVGRWPGREAYGAAPPASRLLRIADATALRAGLDAGASTAPEGSKSGQARACPRYPGPASDDRTHPSRPEPPTPGGRADRAQKHP